MYSNHGERVVIGQRMIQSASDLFLGWTRAKAGFDVYMRQLRDMNMSALSSKGGTSKCCGCLRECAHGPWRRRMRERVMSHADQTISDHKAFAKAIRDGRIQAITDQ